MCVQLRLREWWSGKTNIKLWTSTNNTKQRVPGGKRRPRRQEKTIAWDDGGGSVRQMFHRMEMMCEMSPYGGGGLVLFCTLRVSVVGSFTSVCRPQVLAPSVTPVMPSLGVRRTRARTRDNSNDVCRRHLLSLRSKFPCLLNS